MTEQVSQAGAPVRGEFSERTSRLADGRELGYAEYGDPAGKPVFYFHGWPSSRLEAWGYHAAGVRLGARIIGVDRPGIGLSSYVRGYTIARWPGDVAALADSLGIERFAVVAISSGAPYSYACARFIPEQLTGAAVVSGVGPLDIPEPGKYILKDELQGDLAGAAGAVAGTACLRVSLLADGEGPGEGEREPAGAHAGV